MNWNKYQAKVSTKRQNQNLDFLIDPSFQGVNRVFALPFEDETRRTSYKQCPPTKEIKKLCYDWWTKLFWSTSNN